jgi:hypothetical protein
MNRSISAFAFVIAALFVGWAIGRAQTTTPDFELVVTAPGGVANGGDRQTRIECVRGCDLRWIERGDNPNSSLTPIFSFGCGASECTSGRIGGWIRR